MHYNIRNVDMYEMIYDHVDSNNSYNNNNSNDRIKIYQIYHDT